MSPSLEAALRALARTPHLLAASDFDGVLAPIVSEPSAARPLPRSVGALAALAALPATDVAAISGRALDDLRALLSPPPGMHLVGSHGSEFGDRFAAGLAPDIAELRRRVESGLAELVDGRPGVALETKPVSVAVHVRNAPRDVAAEVLAAVLTGPATWEGVHVTEGKEVVELVVVEASKGTALDLLRSQIGATGVLFVGDDLTDEKAFAVLRDSDVGVKVGPGETLARYRVADPEAVAALLELLASERRAATA
ncbi:MAG TPA: trehalose-phosphatase [Mycobacteriales bacterium]|nr:trehalose-phosphatase [Mycobacteriales bacterium]